DDPLWYPVSPPTPTASSAIYTLSLHDALPIWFPVRHTNAPCPISLRLQRWVYSQWIQCRHRHLSLCCFCPYPSRATAQIAPDIRSEEHTSELQSRENLVCRLLLEKKKNRSQQS